METAVSSNSPKDTFRQTKIVFTLGPASSDEKMLEQLILAGVDVCRLNMAHGDQAWARTMIRRVKEVCQRAGRHIAIMLDIKGPEIRTGDLPAPVDLAQGQLVDLLPRPGASENGVLAVGVNYARFGQDVSAGSVVLVDSGLIRLEVLSTTASRVHCRVAVAGKLGNRRHINLPGVKVRLPAITPKDRADIAVGVEEQVDFFALSFVREADDVDILRRVLTDAKSEAHIIAKIEDQSAIANLDEIIQAADAVMVARGDLGIEVPMEDLPLIQKKTVDACIRLRKPVIVATHLLESMIQSPVATRAEVSDIAGAVWSTADSAMRARRCPIYAFTDVPQVFRHLLLVWGVELFLMTFSEEPELTIRNSFDYLMRRGWVKRDDLMVVVTNVLAGMKIVDTIQMRPVE
jgi:pyruvate kinase